MKLQPKFWFRDREGGDEVFCSGDGRFVWKIERGETKLEVIL